MTTDALVDRAIAALESGQRADARALLLRALRQDRRDEKAWFWLSKVSATPEAKRTCLEEVLSINPSNEAARKELEHLTGPQDEVGEEAASSSWRGADRALREESEETGPGRRVAADPSGRSPYKRDVSDQESGHRFKTAQVVLLAATLVLTLSGNVQTWWYHIQDLQLREQEAALETAALEYRVVVECDPGDQSYLTEWVEVKNVGLGHAKDVYILFNDTGIEVLDAGSEFPRDEVEIHVSETALQVETSPFMLNAGASYRLNMRLANYGSTDTGRVWQIFGIQQNNLEVTTASSVRRSAPYGYLEDLVGFPEVRTHQVGESESLEDVAEAYGLGIDSLINYNPLIAHRKPRPLEPGEILVIQPSACGQARAALTAPREVWYPIGTHIVRSGENLFCIARAYGVEPWAIVDYNVLGGPNSVETGQEVVVPNVYGSLPPGRTCPPQFEVPAPGFRPYPSPPSCRYSHTVVAGENLYRISLRYGVSMYAIAQGNGLNDVGTTLEGQTLCIP